MNRLLWNGLLFCMGMLPITTYAQRFSLGGGTPYSFSAETPGVNLRAYYNVNERFCFGPEYTFFLPRKKSSKEEETKTAIWELNLNFHYIFELHERLGLYPILGSELTQANFQYNPNKPLLQLPLELPLTGNDLDRFST